eukprot:TRINITY_DN11591_c1_g1_i1.p1 TRINITY_DN11591_c1_g1~~TRINITY_DN11591_c1_g1_i1.p1  ORF type:complete len:263 (+),score=35.76 TRINITY_DN11591_c1_g1_i1:294-1082(+)
MPFKDDLLEIFEEYSNYGSSGCKNVIDGTRFARMVRQLLLVDANTRLGLQDADIAFRKVAGKKKYLDFDEFLEVLDNLAMVAFPKLDPDNGIDVLADSLVYVYLSSKNRRTVMSAGKKPAPPGPPRDVLPPSACPPPSYNSFQEPFNFDVPPLPPPPWGLPFPPPFSVPASFPTPVSAHKPKRSVSFTIPDGVFPSLEFLHPCESPNTTLEAEEDEREYEEVLSRPAVHIPRPGYHTNSTSAPTYKINAGTTRTALQHRLTR